jgi:hypothetical protein
VQHKDLYIYKPDSKGIGIPVRKLKMSDEGGKQTTIDFEASFDIIDVFLVR